ncbi:MAG: hypothetical protein U5K54_26305 [Cytophagales bacterium]|nr:hypothetical protein [Cytophagales bacterium]
MKIRSLPGVVRVGGVSNILGTWDGGSGNYKLDKNDKPLSVYDFRVDDNYLENLSLTFLAGRNFDPLEQVGREKDVILNETAITQLGFQNPTDAIGEVLYAQDTLMLRIIGVVKDFHFRPLNNKIDPLALRFNMRDINYLSAQIHLPQKESTIESIKTIWKKFDPTHPMEFAMMEQEIDDAYQDNGNAGCCGYDGICYISYHLSCLSGYLRHGHVLCTG